jgi:hypothetical protein
MAEIITAGTIDTTDLGDGQVRVDLRGWEVRDGDLHVQTARLIDEEPSSVIVDAAGVDEWSFHGLSLADLQAAAS